MFKRDITYEDFNGEKVTDTFYFNLTKTELMELSSNYEGGIETVVQRIMDTKDAKGMIEEFKRIILMSYGVKSEDGKRFIKNDRVREEFSQTPAYDVLFMELATTEDGLDKFLKAVVPKDILEAINEAEQEAKKVLSPPTAMSTESK